MSHEPPDADAFRGAYRELLEAFVRLAPSALTGPPTWAEALFVDPLRFPAELDRPELATPKQRFLVVVSGVVPADRDVYRELARTELRTMFALHAPETQMVQPRAARRTPAPPPHAPSAPPPPTAPGGLGGKLRSVFNALRRGRPTAPQAAPAAAATHGAPSPRPTSRAVPPAPPAPSAPLPPPAVVPPAPPATDVTFDTPVAAPGEPSDEWISRDITGGAPPVDGSATAHHGARAEPPAHDDGDGLLGIDHPSAGAEPTSGVDAKLTGPPPPRYLNALLADREPDAPLDLTTAYELQVSVDLEKLARAASSPPLPGEGLLFGRDEDVITLIIQVTGEDFTIAPGHQELKLPRRGASLGKATFEITPKHEGPCALTVAVHKDGNFVMQLEISYSVGLDHAAPDDVAVLGRPISAATNLKRRELGLTIEPTIGGYKCSVRGATHTSVLLPVSETELADAIKVARDAMMSVVSQRDGAELVFQKGIAIDDASRDRAFRTLAVAGAQLFQRIFYGPAAGADVQRIGDLLKKQATESAYSLDFQVVASRFPVPWGLLYFGDVSDDATIDPDLFLGMRHVVEAIPLQTGMLVDDTVIDSGKPSLAVSVNVNADIDGGKLNLDGVARQLAWWDKCATTAGPHLTFSPRRTKAELLGALRDGARDQFMYLYCHAVTNAPADPGGIQGSAFLLTGNERLTLSDLNREAPMTKPLPGNPLVFINACESGELRPEFYDGFIPYFMAKGARGVVGTECKTPAVFASEWALRFFPRFLDGEPLGDIFLELRREFHAKHGNPLGLLYSVYCNADTRIQPGLTI